ncbi:lysozyme inhibitor LprI family protein [Runella zeae]|uniref:lysozyme inhibitor LprI family protein n=1 Tax=Runella zeae TaxID=94255 RepID=UPI00040AC0B8|nr:lysozyme inhibitor LprI family protein [Runella zeae]
MNFFFSTLVISLSMATASFSQQTPESHPIDVSLDNCMDKNPSTQGMIGCLDEAYKKWDAELNKNYKALNLQLNATQKAALLASQRKWIEYRDLEFKTQAAIYQAMEGTMYLPMAVNDRLEIVKKRALTLKSYLELFNN